MMMMMMMMMTWCVLMPAVQSSIIMLPVSILVAMVFRNCRPRPTEQRLIKDLLVYDEFDMHAETVTKLPLLILARFLRVRDNWKKVREMSGENIFFGKSQGKVREKEKMVPSDVRFSVKNASNLIFSGDPPRPRWGSFQRSPRPDLLAVLNSDP